MFRAFLAKLFYENETRAVNGESLASAINALEGFARYDGKEQRVFVRFAADNGRIFLDLCDERWRVIEIGQQGWRIMGSDECPVRFRRAHGLLALTLPERGGKISELREFLNTASDRDFSLQVAWLIGAFHPQGPYPILILHGEQGSAKTTTEKVLRGLIDPNDASERSEPREARDLMVAARNGWVCSFGNLSHLHPWFSDALCRLSTGGGFSTRTLYTDSDEMIFSAKRPVILNGIEELATRGDLLDRALIVYLPSIPEAERRGEFEFNAAYQSARPRLLGALLDAVSAALANNDLVTIEKLPRMADFAKWVTASEPALGWQSGTFLSAYGDNRSEANDVVLETPVVEALRKVALPWDGTATQLLGEINSVVDERERRSKSWPASGRALSNALRRLAPNLRRAGIKVQFSREGHGRQRTIRIQSENHWNSASAAPAPVNSDNKVSTADCGADNAARRSVFGISELDYADGADSENRLPSDDVVAEEEL
jgi:hypothetical protein